MRRLIPVAALVAAGVVGACASTGTPPGGPEDKNPPAVAATSPDSGATNVNAKQVSFTFTKVVNDRPSGATELNQLFLISPNDGDPRVAWHRSRIDVRPRKGFRPNTAYRITLLPGLADMRGNVMKETKTIVFSTGATFPRFGILGRVFDWESERPMSGAYVEAISLPDSTDYISASDTTGEFDLGPLPAGKYLVRGMFDENRNRKIDPREKWDTTTVVVTDTRPTVELRVIPRDTLSVNIAAVDTQDSLTLKVTFDKALAPDQPFRAQQFRIVGADSVALSIASVITESAADSIRKAQDDSATKAREDSIARADTTKKAAPPAAAPVPTAKPVAPPTPKPRFPAPPKALIVRLAPTTPLVPGKTYRLTESGLRNLLGYQRQAARLFTVPKRAATDSTRKAAPTDTTRRLPVSPARPAKPPR